MLVDHYDEIYSVLQISMKKLMQTNQDGSRNSFVDHLPHYAGLEWRLDAIVGSRALPSNEVPQVAPIITMKLKLRTSNTDTGSTAGSPLEGEENIYRHILLQTDPVNLCHITDVLENALKESRSQQFRKLQK